MEKIFIDNGRWETTLWFGEGFTVLKGNTLEENAAKIYNIATTKYVCDLYPDKYYIKQNYELYIDYPGLGQPLYNILTEKYKLKVNKCELYRDHKDYRCDVQEVINISKSDYRFNKSKECFVKNIIEQSY